MMKGKMNIAVSVVILVIVVAILIFISINKKDKSPLDSQESGLGQNTQEKNIMPNNQENTQLPEGVKVTILKEGNGEVAKSGDTVAMNYTGKLTNGTVFDSNVDPKFQHVEPFVFTVGAGQVIKGWDIGVAGMKVGEKRNLLLQPDYAYGARGAGSAIPPNATLSFDVELLAIKK